MASQPTAGGQHRMLRFVFRTAVLVGRGLGVAAVVIGWCSYKWLTGADWRHNYRGRRRVTRPVRATGQTLLAVVVLLLIWRPLVVATGLAVAGGCLVTAALVTRHRAAQRALPAPGGPIRVRATVGPPRPVTSSRGRTT